MRYGTKAWLQAAEAGVIPEEWDVKPLGEMSEMITSRIAWMGKVLFFQRSTIRSEPEY